MLNTDMCLAYSKDLKASTSNCCAWDRYRDLRDENIRELWGSQNNTDTFIHCGFTGVDSELAANFSTDRSRCCAGSAPATDCAQKDVNGDSFTLQGPAVDAVRAFAANQDTWLGEFKSVWNLVTEKGAGTLFQLETGLNPCTVTVYEHWPAGMTSGLPGL